MQSMPALYDLQIGQDKPAPRLLLVQEVDGLKHCPACNSTRVCNSQYGMKCHRCGFELRKKGVAM
jgi:hypothetical protein